ncbi:MAG: DUF1738 domain-containing protein, partial [Candidatus Omnitrophica bacterium]|nr:DUF1738 domain-containing protein [Candidatus Omnitrophota bacterium]
MGNFNIYEEVTNRIIESLEKGVVPWRKPWACGLPRNFLTKKYYRGINSFLLYNTPHKEPYYLTYLQIQKLGGTLIKGSKSYIVVFWKWIENKHEYVSDKCEDLKTKTPFLRYYRVFNIEQTTGIDYVPYDINANHDVRNIDRCEQIINNYKTCPNITHNEQRAYYSPSSDYINMPVRASFNSSEAYYSTLFHEITHSTGHINRLNRKGISESAFFGDQNYSFEELVAEMGASFLCAESGI